MDANGKIDLTQLDELARRLANLAPPAGRSSRDELRENIKALLRDMLGSMGLVTRTEFEFQRIQLSLMRDRLASMESRWGADSRLASGALRRR